MFSKIGILGYVTIMVFDIKGGISKLIKQIFIQF
jgi:hypothetical protein